MLYPFPKLFHASLVCTHKNQCFIFHFINIECMVLQKNGFSFTFSSTFVCTDYKLPVYLSKPKAAESVNSLNPLLFCLFNITKNPFLVLLMSLNVVLLKPAWTESVKPVQIVNNVLEIQISELAALNENERLAFLLTHMAK